MEAVQGSKPCCSDATSAVAVASVEDSVVAQLVPRRPGSQDGVVGNHRGVVSAVPGSSAVAQRRVELVPRSDVEVFGEHGLGATVDDASNLQVVGPRVAEVVPRGDVLLHVPTCVDDVLHAPLKHLHQPGAPRPWRLALHGVRREERSGKRAEEPGRVMVRHAASLDAYGHQVVELLGVWVPQTDTHGPHGGATAPASHAESQLVAVWLGGTEDRQRLHACSAGSPEIHVLHAFDVVVRELTTMATHMNLHCLT